jgi:Flp pilus assembly protein TadB
VVLSPWGTAVTAVAAWLAAAGVVFAVPTPRPGGLRIAGLAMRSPIRSGLRLGRLQSAKVLGTCGVVGCVVAGAWRGPVVAAALGLLLAAVTYAVHVAGRRRSSGRATTALLAAVRMISAELSAGSLEPEALLAGAAVAGPHTAALTSAASAAFVLAGLPLVGLALAAEMGAHPVAFLTSSAVGRLVLLVGAVLAATGLTWSVWLASRAESAP